MFGAGATRYDSLRPSNDIPIAFLLLSAYENHSLQSSAFCIIFLFPLTNRMFHSYINVDAEAQSEFVRDFVMLFWSVNYCDHFYPVLFLRLDIYFCALCRINFQPLCVLFFMPLLFSIVHNNYFTNIYYVTNFLSVKQWQLFNGSIATLLNTGSCSL